MRWKTPGGVETDFEQILSFEGGHPLRPNMAGNYVLADQQGRLYAHIDAQTVFYPEQGNQTPLKSQLQVLIGQCNEEEARVLIPVIESLLSALRCSSTNETL